MSHGRPPATADSLSLMRQVEPTCRHQLAGLELSEPLQQTAATGGDATLGEDAEPLPTAGAAGAAGAAGTAAAAAVARKEARNSSSNASRHVRLFVASSFKDMGREREALADRAFPRLRAFCSRKGLMFTEVDLRWVREQLLPACTVALLHGFSLLPIAVALRGRIRHRQANSSADTSCAP